MADPTTWRVRWHDESAARTVTVACDLRAGTATVTTTDGQVITVDANTGRAITMALAMVVYPVLAPSRVEMTTEYYRRGRWYGGQR